MYSEVKRLLKQVVGEKILLALERPLRGILSLVYLGNAVECPVCKTTHSRFINYPNGEKLCPGCGSLARKRFLSVLLKRESEAFVLPMILHFTPHRGLKRSLKKQFGKWYLASDFGNPEADRQFDIRQIDTVDGSFDMVICYHVLEHIDEDRKAMAELYRVLKPGGLLVTQVPFGVETHENPLITDPVDRLKHFGQEDHVRIYGFDDFCARLSDAGFKIRVVRPTDYLDGSLIVRLGLRPDERVVLGLR